MNQNDDYETRADAEFDRIKEERPDRCQCDMCLFIDQLGELHDLSGMSGMQEHQIFIPGPETEAQRYRKNYDRIFGDK